MNMFRHNDIAWEMANASSSSLLGVVVAGASRLSKRRGCNDYKRRQAIELKRGMQRPSDLVVDRAGCLVQSAVRFCFQTSIRVNPCPFAVPIGSRSRRSLADADPFAVRFSPCLCGEIRSTKSLRSDGVDTGLLDI